MPRMLRVVSRRRKNSWYWEVLCADDSHIIDCGREYSREAALAAANRSI